MPGKRTSWCFQTSSTPQGGHFIRTMIRIGRRWRMEDSTTTTQAGLTPGSTAPFQPSDNHNQSYHSGMLQSWNKFCFTSGYIEVDVNLPGPDQNTQGYWDDGARPGYSASTDGMWPYKSSSPTTPHCCSCDLVAYRYNSCDMGTFPNPTLKDLLGPAACSRRTRLGRNIITS